MLRDPATFSMEKGYEKIYAKGFAEEFKEILSATAAASSPTRSCPIRPITPASARLMEQAFTAHRVKQLEPRIAEVVGDLIEKLADQGQCGRGATTSPCR